MSLVRVGGRRRNRQWYGCCQQLCQWYKCCGKGIDHSGEPAQRWCAAVICCAVREPCHVRQLGLIRLGVLVGCKLRRRQRGLIGLRPRECGREDVALADAIEKGRWRT